MASQAEVFDLVLGLERAFGALRAELAGQIGSITTAVERLSEHVSGLQGQVARAADSLARVETEQTQTRERLATQEQRAERQSEQNAVSRERWAGLAATKATVLLVAGALAGLAGSLVPRLIP